MTSRTQPGSRYGLSEATIQKICAVFVRYPQVEKAILYGSRATGTYENGSDIDLTLCGGSDLTLDALCRIRDELDDLLLPYAIDVSIFRDIGDSAVVDHIHRVGVPMYEKGLSDEEFEALADQLADEFMACVGPDCPPLSDCAVSREGLYGDHL